MISQAVVGVLCAVGFGFIVRFVLWPIVLDVVGLLRPAPVAAEPVRSPGAELASIGTAQQRAFVSDTARRLAEGLGREWPQDFGGRRG
jgi:hypothetical protein